jgi:hypothetical protein
MKDSENYIVDFFEFSGPNEITKHRFEGEINLRLPLAEGRMKNERRKEHQRLANMERSSGLIHCAQTRLDQGWIKMDRSTRRASSRKVHQGRTSY